MPESETKMRLIRAQARILLEWYLFQEQNDIRIESSSLHINEVEFAKKLSAAIVKLGKASRGSSIYISGDEVVMARNWYEHLPEPLLEEHDKKMFQSIVDFCTEKLT